MEEEPKTADLRKQLKEDKKKFDKAMDCILALEKSASGTAEESETDGFEDQDDVELDVELDDVEQSNGQASELGDPYAASSLAQEEEF